MRSPDGSNNDGVTEDGIVDVGGAPPAGVGCSGGNAILDATLEVGDGVPRRNVDRKTGDGDVP